MNHVHLREKITISTMENQNSVQDSIGFRNSCAFFSKKMGKVLGVAALAFTAQYAHILQTPPAYAAVPTTQRQVTPVKSPKLSQLDQGYMLVDEARTLKTGLVYLRGEQVVAFPAIDPDTKEPLLLTLRRLPEEETDPYLDELAQAMGCNDCRILDQGTNSFPVATQMLLKDGNPTEDEQRRIYFSLAYFYAAMSGGDIDDLEVKFEKAVVKFRELDDGSSWFQERLQDVELLRSFIASHSFKLLSESKTAQKRDIQRLTRDISYPRAIRDAVRVLQARTQAYKAGQMPTNEYIMGLAIFARFSQHHLTYLQNIPKRGWASGTIYTEAMESIEVILPALQDAFDAAGNEQELEHLAQAREKLMIAQQLLGYQAILASSAYAMKNISGEQMIRWGNESYRFSQALLAQHGAEKLYLPPDFEAGLQQAYFAYTGAMPRYAELNNAANMGTRLSQLLAKVSGQGNRWQEADKAALKELYRTASLSPSEDAQKQFLEVVQKEAVVASQPKMVIKPFQETGTTVNFSLTPIVVEKEGVKTVTTYHPVHTVIATFTIENKLPFAVRVPFVIEIPAGEGLSDNPRVEEDVYVPGNSYADITYSAHVSVTSDSVPIPRGQLNLAMKTLHEAVASSSRGERLASAE